MSDDNSKDSAATPNQQNQAAPARPHQDEDIFASVRRFADEQISAALHSVFGIPSILQPPANSNWIIEESDRNSDGRFEDISRREGADESRNSSDDNEGRGNNGSGSGMSGFGGGSGSSGSQSGSSTGSSSNRDRKDDDDDDDEFKIPVLWTPTISQLLLSLGLHSTALLERNFGHFHKEFQKLLEQEAANQKKNLESSDALVERVAPSSETIIIKGSQKSDEEPKFTVTKYTGQPPSSFWKEFFGEEMYGANRTHPLFTSLFDEFLPDGQYNRQPPPKPVGGWRQPGEMPLFPSIFPADPIEALFGMMVGPTLRRLEESGDTAYNDEMRKEADKFVQEFFSGKSDGLQIQEHLEKINREKLAKKEQQFLQSIQERRDEVARLREAWEEAERKVHSDRMQEKAIAPIEMQRQDEKREPETELDMHNFFASFEKTNGKDVDKKVLVAQSTSTTSTTDANGITRTKKVKERRYSDGSVEREEHDEESQSQQRVGAEGWGSWGEYGFPQGLGHRRDEMRRAFAEERERTETQQKSISATSSSEATKEDSQNDGGWGSWFWASGKK